MVKRSITGEHLIGGLARLASEHGTFPAPHPGLFRLRIPAIDQTRPVTSATGRRRCGAALGCADRGVDYRGVVTGEATPQLMA